VADLTLRMFAQFHPTEHSVNNDMPVVNSGSLGEDASSPQGVVTGQPNQEEKVDTLYNKI